MTASKSSASRSSPEVSVTTSLPVPVRAQSGAGRGRVGGRQRAGYAFVALYIVLLLFFGVAPTAYALYLAFTKAGGHWAGLSNFFATGRDFRFLPAYGAHRGSTW